MVEVTTRTIHGRFLLKPSPRCVEIIEGVLGRALAVNPEIRLVGYWFLSNHYGLLAVMPDAPTLSAFMDHVNGNLAKELGRLYGWRERFWGRRKTGRKPLGVKAILAQDPHDKPTNSARSPAPLSHGNRGERHWFKNLYWDFVRRYRAASQRLRDGVIEAISEFPPCCFLPRLPLGIRLECAPPDTPGLQPTI